MVSGGAMLKSVLVATVLVVLTESGSAAEHLVSCCTKVTTEEITDPITGYMIQNKRTPPCVKAIVFQTDKGLFCAYHRAPWVARKIKAFERAKHQTSSPPSLSSP